MSATKPCTQEWLTVLRSSSELQDLCLSFPKRVEVAKWTFFAYLERGNWKPSSLKKGNQMFMKGEELKTMNPQERYGVNPPDCIRFSISSSLFGLMSTTSQSLPATANASEWCDHIFLL